MKNKNIDTYIREIDVLFRMIGLSADLQTIELVIRGLEKYNLLGDQFTLRDAVELKLEVEQKYKDEEE